MFKIGDRIYHHRWEHKSISGFGIILEIDGTRAKLKWEHNGKEGGVEVRALYSEAEAADALVKVVFQKKL